MIGSIVRSQRLDDAGQVGTDGAFGIGFTIGPLLGFASLFVDSAGAPGFTAALLSGLAGRLPPLFCATA